MEYSVTTNNNECVFGLKGDLRFSDSSVVRTMIGEIKNMSEQSVKLDLAELSSIDSAGLGMILLVNDAAGDEGKSFAVSGATGQVKKMLDISKFNDLMTITD
jgi:stage II sporulation protein AA (anti-sigma F factor antagonist)